MLSPQGVKPWRYSMTAYPGAICPGCGVSILLTVSITLTIIFHPRPSWSDMHISHNQYLPNSAPEHFSPQFSPGMSFFHFCRLLKSFKKLAWQELARAVNIYGYYRYYRSFPIRSSSCTVTCRLITVTSPGYS